MGERRVGGSGWAGVYGSFIGLNKSTTKGAGARIRAAKKANPNRETLRPTEVELALRSSDERLVQAAKRVRAVQADIDGTTTRLTTLKSQYRTLSARLKDEIKRVNGGLSASTPISKFRRKK